MCFYKSHAINEDKCEITHILNDIPETQIVHKTHNKKTGLDVYCIIKEDWFIDYLTCGDYKIGRLAEVR